MGNDHAKSFMYGTIQQSKVKPDLVVKPYDLKWQTWWQSRSQSFFSFFLISNYHFFWNYYNQLSHGLLYMASCDVPATLVVTFFTRNLKLFSFLVQPTILMPTGAFLVPKKSNCFQVKPHLIAMWDSLPIFPSQHSNVGDPQSDHLGTWSHKSWPKIAFGLSQLVGSKTRLFPDELDGSVAPCLLVRVSWTGLGLDLDCVF